MHVVSICTCTFTLTRKCTVALSLLCKDAVSVYYPMQSLQRVDVVTGGRHRNNTISGPAYASVGPSFMSGIHHVAAKNFGSTGNLDSRHNRVTRRRSLGVVCVHVTV